MLTASQKLTNVNNKILLQVSQIKSCVFYVNLVLLFQTKTIPVETVAEQLSYVYLKGDNPTQCLHRFCPIEYLRKKQKSDLIADIEISLYYTLYQTYHKRIKSMLIKEKRQIRK